MNPFRIGISVVALTAMSAFSADFLPEFHTNDIIVFQGDSITEGGRQRTGNDYNHTMGQDYAYIIAARLSADYPERHLTFINRGISGNRVSDLAARWQKDTLDLKPDVLSILIGVNDVAFAVQTTNHISTEVLEKTYDHLLAQARAANPKLKIMLGEPFILPGESNHDRWNEWRMEIRSLQSVVERLAAKYHAPVVRYQKMFDQAAKRAVPANYWIWDGIHPNYAGHQLMANEWMRTYSTFFGLNSSNSIPGL